MSEGAWFYDNNRDDDDPEIAEIDRIYCFDESRWTEEHYQQLGKIFKELPGYQDPMPDRGPYWFGTDDEDIPHLWASLEPPGLQVAGVLARKDWEAWHQAFWEKIQDFPFREQW